MHGMEPGTGQISQEILRLVHERIMVAVCSCGDSQCQVSGQRFQKAERQIAGHSSQKGKRGRSRFLKQRGGKVSQAVQWCQCPHLFGPDSHGYPSHVDTEWFEMV